MIGLLNSENLIELLVSTTIDAPSILDLEYLPVIDSSTAMKLTNLYMDEATNYLNNIGLSPLPQEILEEVMYAVCNEGSLVFIGRFLGGLIPSKIVLSYKTSCNSDLFIHTHPVPVPIPSFEDIISAKQIGYSVECVASKVSKSQAVLTCIKPRRDWNDIINVYDKVVDIVINAVNKYVVVGNGKDNIIFVPLPTVSEVQRMLAATKTVLKPYAELMLVNVNLRTNIFDFM
jgi:hypothetical protein